MARHDDSRAAYEVGYRKPPRDKQFRPGQSGNPKGRPKGRPTLRSMLEKRLYQRTKVTVCGDVKSIAILEAGVLRIVHSLVQGSPANAIAAMKLIIPILALGKEESPSYDLTRLTNAELDQLESLQRKITITNTQ